MRRQMASSMYNNDPDMRYQFTLWKKEKQNAV